MRVAGTLEYAAGGLTLLTGMLLPDAQPSDHRAFTALALIGLVAAVVRWCAPRKLPVAVLSLVFGYVYIAAIVASARPLTASAFFFIWPTLTAGYFLGRRGLYGGLVGVAIGLALSLSANTSVANFHQEFLGIWAMTAVVCTLVLLMRERHDVLLQDLEELATLDGLTGLLNRRAYDARGQALCAEAGAQQQEFALVMFDLDHFKAINDQHGHEGGDRALQRFAELLRDAVPASAVVARIGGEEFAVLLPDTSLSDAFALGTAVQARVREATAREAPALSTSAGVSSTALAQEWDGLCRSADDALYVAKRTGRARVVCAPAQSPLMTVELPASPAALPGDSYGTSAAS